MTIANVSKKTGLLLMGWSLVAFSAWRFSFSGRTDVAFRFALWLVGGAIAIRFGARRDRSAKWAAAAALLGLAVGFYYSALTPIDVRAHDVVGHLENVEFIRANGSYPRMDAGWESFQPPLYYLAVLAVTAIGLVPSDLSYLLFAATLLGFLHWRPNGIALAFLGLLPAHLFFAGRMNNDVAFPLFGLGFLLLHERIAKEESGVGTSLAMGALVAASVLTKLSGIAFGAALLPTLYREVRAKRWGRVFAMTILPVAALAFWFGRSYLQTGNPLYTNIAAMPVELRIPNDLNRFLGFDPRAFFGQVSADPWGGPLREQLWPYFIVTALQGEFPYPADYSILFLVERVCAVALVLGVIAFSVREWSRRRETFRTFIRSGAVSLVAAQTSFFVALSAMNPFGPNHDARYWGIAFPAIGWILAEVGDRLDSRGLRAGFFAVNGALVVALLVFYEKLLAF